MDQSIFMNKAAIPNENDLKNGLGEPFKFWLEISEMVMMKYPKAKPEWSYPGKNYGWSFRLKDKKRVIIYLLPRSGYFKVAFVFGQKAFDMIMSSQISDSIKTELSAARVYAEGRGIRIDVKESAELDDIKKLIEIKLAN
jgi:hypothetical protein